MDPFKLLSSSTKIRGLEDKHKRSSEAPDLPINSTRKRKRASPSIKAENALSTVNSGGREIDLGRLEQVEIQASKGISLVERKKLLRSHKIKVLRLLEPTSIIHTSHAAPSRSQDGLHRKSKQKVEVTPDPLLHFSELRTRYAVPEVVTRNLLGQGFTSPTEVQLASLPLLLETNEQVEAQISNATASQDHPDGPVTPACHLLSIAPTGSGKTLSFLVPVLQCIILTRRRRKENSIADASPPLKDGPFALVLAPTKELAKQIVNEARRLSNMTGIRATLVTRGMDVSAKADHASGSGQHVIMKADILVSTPQALLNASRDTNELQAPFPSVSMLVLDEADVLLDPLFREQTMSVWSSCTHPALQVSLWSATMGSNVEQIAASTIAGRRPRSRLSLNRLVVGLKDSSIPNIEHQLVYAASEQGKLTALRQLLRTTGSSGVTLPKIHPPFLIFMQTIPRAIALHAELLYDVPQEAGGSSRIAVLHADLSDTARDRVMTEFRRGDIWILITTDLLARGVDFRGVNGVVNYDLPNSSAVYVHRVGRTGRAGREGGVAITLYSKDDLPFVKNVANVIAASERQNAVGKVTDRQWIVDSLPKPTKRDKQRLKQRGVESRRISKGRDDGRLRSDKTTISTKSAYERRKEKRRKGAVEGSKQREAQRGEQDAVSENFQSFDSD